MLTRADLFFFLTIQKKLHIKFLGISEAEILDKIVSQGDKVRKLKSEKADKAAVDAEVKLLLAYKTEYKNLTGKEWKPGTVPSVPETKCTTNSGMTFYWFIFFDIRKKISYSICIFSGASEIEILDKIASQGDKIRKLKSEKSDKTALDAEVKVLLAYKTEYKNLTGKDWKPGTVASKPVQNQNTSVQSSPPVEVPSAEMASGDSDAKERLTVKINEQGNAVRNLKSSGASKVSPLIVWIEDFFCVRIKLHMKKLHKQNYTWT